MSGMESNPKPNLSDTPALDRLIENYPYITNPPRWVQPANWPERPTYRQHYIRMAIDFGYFFDMSLRVAIRRTCAPIQWLSAYHVSNFEESDVLLMASRQWSKSTMTVFFCSWLLYRDANHRIIVVHKDHPHARQFTSQVRRTFNFIPWLRHLAPQRISMDRNDPRNLNRADEFNCFARTDWVNQDPNMYAVGIFGDATGRHCDHVIFDDIETVKNSRTEDLREKIIDQVAQYDFICSEGARRVYLGTPKQRYTIYNRLPGIEPSDDYDDYASKVDQPLSKRGSRLLIPGLDANDESTFPEVKTTEQLIRERGRDANRPQPRFRLEVMLDLAEHDLDQMPLRPGKFPIRVVDTHQDMIMAIDPSRGLGGDEHAVAIGCVLRSLEGLIGTVDNRWADKRCIYLRHVDGFRSSFGENMKATIDLARRFRVTKIVAEANITLKGHKNYIQRLRDALLDKGLGHVQVKDFWETRDKLERILEIMQPPLEDGEIAVHPSVFADPRTSEQFDHTLVNEISEPNDRLDAAAMLSEELLTMLRRNRVHQRSESGRKPSVASMVNLRRNS